MLETREVTCESCEERTGNIHIGLIIVFFIHLIHKWPPTWDERAAKHGIEAFWDKSLFSCKPWSINWPTYVEIIGHLKAISFMRQFPDC